MDDTSPANAEQAALWNGHAGSAWVRTQAVLDAMFQPLEARLSDAVRAVGARRVLDVGCGDGQLLRRERQDLLLVLGVGAVGEPVDPPVGVALPEIVVDRVVGLAHAPQATARVRRRR